MHIKCLPLDIRPYNYDFLVDIAAMDERVNVELPPKSSLGFKKTAANMNAVEQFLLADTPADAFLISIDMLVYGGLFPARSHQLTAAQMTERLSIVKKIKLKHPNTKIYCSSLILRTPQYNSNEEEPDYYGEYGLRIFTLGYLRDKQQRGGLSATEQAQLQQYETEVPQHYLEDFSQRREKNIRLTQHVMDLVQQGIITMLIIPQDDASEFGFTAIDQIALYSKVSAELLHDRVFLHPGTDESGCTLLTRAYLDHYDIPMGVYDLWSNEQFKHTIPNYEDRPFLCSLTSHLRACGMHRAKDPGQAQAVLAINGCGDRMQEAFTVAHGIDVFGNKVSAVKDISYHRQRDWVGFFQELTTLSKTLPIGMADLAFSNGGEKELIQYLDHFQLLDKLAAYAGWNTTCNSLGTVLAALTFATYGGKTKPKQQFLAERLISDWAYQTEVRFAVQCDYMPQQGISYANFGEQEHSLMAEIKRQVEHQWHATIKQSFKANPVSLLEVSAPFKRLSGLKFNVSLP